MRNICLNICSCSETNPEGGERGTECVFSVDKPDFDEVLTKRKGEKKIALNAFASNTSATLSNILPTGFVVHFMVDLETARDKMEKFSFSLGVVLKQNNQDTTCIKYVYR